MKLTEIITAFGFIGIIILVGCNSGKDVSGETGKKPEGTQTAAGWLEVRGNRIYHSDGTVFRGRGANIHDTRSCNACTWSAPDVDEVKRRIDKLVDDWGADFVRFVLESYDEPYNEWMVHWLPPEQDTAYLADIVELVEYMGTKPGLYVLVSLWIHPSHDDMGWPTPATETVWKMLAEALVSYPHVLFGVVNEPKSNSSGAQDGEVWDRMNSVVAAIREVERNHGDNRHLIAVQGTRSWARDLEYYVDHPITAGDGVNIVYETHSYLKKERFEEVWIKPSEKLPVIIGEFGPADMGGGSRMTIEETILMMDEAEKRDISYAAWTFHQRCPPSLLKDPAGKGCGTDMELVPTEWGKVIKERLSQAWKSE